MHNHGLCSFLAGFQYLNYPNYSITFSIGLCNPLVVTLLETSQEFTKQGLDPPDLCEDSLFRKPQETHHAEGVLI